MRIVSLVLVTLNSQFGTNFAMVIADATVATLPMLSVFIVLQKYFIRGIALTGPKN